MVNKGQVKSCKLCSSPYAASIALMYIMGLSFREMIRFWDKMLREGDVDGDPLTLSLLSKHKLHVIENLDDYDRQLMQELGTELVEFQGGESFLNPDHESKYTFKASGEA